MIATTYHTYSDLLLNGGRLAASDWGNIRTGSVTLAEAVAATINRDAEAIVLRVSNDRETVRGLAPGGLG
jgi:hypothetical protein